MIKPKVSVLMPIYNTPLEHLKESIESILNQTFTDFEFLILNDSPDNQALDEFVSSFKDDRIHYFKNDKNRGIEYSTNFLIKQAKGEYLAIFDHDDISLPERLEKEVAFLDENPDHGVISGQFEVFGVESWTSQNPLTDVELKELLKTVSCISHTSLMVRAEILHKNKIRYEKKFFPAASYRIITRLAAVTKVANLPDVVLKYRMDGNNTSLKFADKRAEARAKIQADYRSELRRQNLVSTGKFDKVELIKTDSMSAGDNHYRAEKAGKKFFIKESVHSFGWEFEATKRAFEQSQDHFSEPIESFEQNGWNYLVLKWEDGENLAKFAKENELTAAQKKSFVKDLEEILTALRAAKLVHRDIIPRNFMVVGGRLKLVDFYFAVDSKNYREYDYIENDISQISALGEEFAKKIYTWDDADALNELVNYFGAKSNKIAKFIGDVIIQPSYETALKNLTLQREEIHETMLEKLKFEDMVRAKDRDIVGLQKHIKDQQKHIKDQQKHIKDQQNRISALEQEINEYQKTLQYRAKEAIKKTIRRG